MSEEIPTRTQAEEVALVVLGMKANLNRMIDGTLKRPPEDADRLKGRIRVLEAATKTLTFVAEKQEERRAAL
jgi:hypothetical protein